MTKRGELAESEENDILEDFTRACPFCGEHQVQYDLLTFHAHHPNDESCFIFVVECPSCGRLPAHMTRDRVEGIDN